MRTRMVSLKNSNIEIGVKPEYSVKSDIFWLLLYCKKFSWSNVLEQDKNEKGTKKNIFMSLCVVRAVPFLVLWHGERWEEVFLEIIGIMRPFRNVCSIIGETYMYCICQKV